MKKPIGGILLLAGIGSSFYAMNKYNSFGQVLGRAAGTGYYDASLIPLIFFGFIIASVGVTLFFIPSKK
ncbi:hypothetical protein [Tolypothrix sp. VBCCA 56010]|uniref:hypothetical protein n=1 Tax=Tolypothrix sp. VBCCA 56010 TaxID=3137731 RepID=UPI003D7DE0C9